MQIEARLVCDDNAHKLYASAHSHNGLRGPLINYQIRENIFQMVHRHHHRSVHNLAQPFKLFLLGKNLP